MATPRPETMAAWSALLVAHRRLITELDDELSAQGVTLDEYDVLHQLNRAGGEARMSDLAQQVLISRATTTRVVDRLVERGWVERTRDEVDRRVVRVALSSEGRRELRRAARVHLDGIARRFEARLSPAQIDALGDALSVLIDP